MKVKVIYVVSEIDKSLHFEWITLFLQANFDLSFILIGKPGSSLEQFLRNRDVAVFPLVYSSKADLPKVWLETLNLLRTHRPDVVHTHLWIANLVGLTAAWTAGVRKRIYTRHHATIHHKQHRGGLKWDRLCNRLATHIIAISRNVHDILIRLDKADVTKIRLLHHGFEFSYFQDVNPNRIDGLRAKYHLDEHQHPVVGVIGRFTEWKGVQFVIQAFERLRASYNTAHLIMANAHGDYEGHITQFLNTLPAKSYTRIRFEHDLAALYRLFDLFVHVPIDADSEAFGQTYVEPLITGVPCIFTLSGVAPEFIVHGQNALVVGFSNPEQIHDAMLRIIREAPLRRALVENGKRSVAGFTIETYLTGLKDLYLE